jgi:hypothetical protein
MAAAETLVDTNHRYVPVDPMSSGYCERVEFHYEPNSSVTRQTKVDIGLSTIIPNVGTVSWSVGNEQIAKLSQLGS